MNHKKMLSLLTRYKKYIFVSFLIIPVTVLAVFAGTALYNIARASFGSWGDNSLVHACKDARGRVTIVGSGDSCNQNETQVTWLKDVNAGDGLTITRSSDGATLSLTDTAADGWTAANETWTYASADDPTFTFTISGDKTGKYSAGMRVKLTQTSAKYFLITKVSYSAPDTIVTVYGGTDYDLVNATITSPYYSMVKAPHGFPLDPTKWTVSLTDTSYRSTDPTASTYYNLGSLSVDVPTGAWTIYFSSNIRFNGSGWMEGKWGLSTSTSSIDDELSCYEFRASLSQVTITNCFVRKEVMLTQKTTYYIIEYTSTDLSEISLNGPATPTRVRAVSSYL